MFLERGSLHFTLYDHQQAMFMEHFTEIDPLTMIFCMCFAKFATSSSI